MARPHLLDALNHHVLLCDGGMGSRVQMLDLEVERDYWGQENCTEVLTLSRPELVREIHRGYFEAGADMVETNTFGGSVVTLAEFGLQDRSREINRRSAELAREAAETFADGRHRYVVGSIGPGTKLPSLGNIDYDTLEAGIAEQCRGLIDGGVDAFLIETCQDTLQIKAAVNAAKLARRELGSNAPIFVQVTVETTGTLLVGPDIAAAATTIHALDVPLIGMNCATGPQEMAEHVKWLSENWPGLISIQPNAGLPELVNGATHYPLTPAEMATWVERFIAEDGLNLVGGCCGTSTPISKRWTPCSAAVATTSGARLPSHANPSGCRPSRASIAKRRCGRKTATFRSANAATPTVRRNGANFRKSEIGTGASPSAVNKPPKARTRSISAPPSSGVTKSRR